MKNILFIVFTTFLLSFTTATNAPIERLGIKGPLVFNNASFKLAWSEQPSKNYYVQEYLPEGDKLENFNEMVSIFLFKTEINLQDAVDQKLKELTARKKTDPVCNYQVNESPDGKEFIVDFLLGESKNDRMTVVEFNAYHYKLIKIAKDTNAIVVYAYSKRAYGDKIGNFLNTLETDRSTYLNAMITKEIPVIKIK